MFYNMKLKARNALIFLAFFIVATFILDHFLTKKMNKRTRRLNIEYPLITKEDSINGMVNFIFHPDGFKENPYGRYIKVSNEGKKSILAKRNEEHTVIGDVIKVGSHLYKEPGSDTIRLQNISNQDTSTYYFELWNRNFE